MDGLPVFRVVFDAIGEIGTKWRSLFKALILPALAATSVEAIQATFPDRFPWPLIFWVFSAPFYVLFAVVCHRVVILGESSLPSGIGIFWSERETRFLGWTVALIIASWGLGLVLGMFALILPGSILGLSTPWLPYLVTGAFLFYFYIRLSLVFPATAVDRSTSLADAMLLSTGNGLRMMAAVLIPSIPLLGFGYVLSVLIGDLNSIADLVVWEITAYAIMTITVCVVSVIYRLLADLDFIEDAT